MLPMQREARLKKSKQLPPSGLIGATLGQGLPRAAKQAHHEQADMDALLTPCRWSVGLRGTDGLRLILTIANPIIPMPKKPTVAQVGVGQDSLEQGGRGGGGGGRAAQHNGS